MFVAVGSKWVMGGGGGGGGLFSSVQCGEERVRFFQPIFPVLILFFFFLILIIHKDVWKIGSYSLLKIWRF